MLLPDSNKIDFIGIFRLMYNEERSGVGIQAATLRRCEWTRRQKHTLTRFPDAVASSPAFPRRSVTAIKLRKKLRVRRIKIRKKALFDPLILPYSCRTLLSGTLRASANPIPADLSRREKGLSSLNLMAVTPERGNDKKSLLSFIKS